MSHSESGIGASTVRYIEVTGEGSYVEVASRYIAEVRFEIRAAKDETAFREVAELAGEGIKILRESGIEEEEIAEGGADLQRPWYWRKHVGQTAERKLILKVDDFNRLNCALEKLEPLQSRNKERKSVNVDMKQPEFDVGTDVKAATLVTAFEDAKLKAQQLAKATGGSLGDVLRVEESGWAKRNSGFSGDEDWGGDNARFGWGGAVLLAGPAAVAATASEEPKLAKPERTIFVKCRVRFAIVGSAD